MSSNWTRALLCRIIHDLLESVSVILAPQRLEERKTKVKGKLLYAGHQMRSLECSELLMGWGVIDDGGDHQLKRIQNRFVTDHVAVCRRKLFLSFILSGWFNTNRNPDPAVLTSTHIPATEIQSTRAARRHARRSTFTNPCALL